MYRRKHAREIAFEEERRRRWDEEERKRQKEDRKRLKAGKARKAGQVGEETRTNGDKQFQGDDFSANKRRRITPQPADRERIIGHHFLIEARSLFTTRRKRIGPDGDDALTWDAVSPTNDDLALFCQNHHATAAVRTVLDPRRDASDG